MKKLKNLRVKTPRFLLITIILLTVYPVKSPIHSEEPGTPTEEYVLQTKWGTYSYGDGQFYAAIGVVTDSEGNLYVADRELHRIQKFDPWTS